MGWSLFMLVFTLFLLQFIIAFILSKSMFIVLLQTWYEIYPLISCMTKWKCLEIHWRTWKMKSIIHGHSQFLTKQSKVIKSQLVMKHNHTKDETEVLVQHYKIYSRSLCLTQSLSLSLSLLTLSLSLPFCLFLSLPQSLSHLLLSKFIW